MAAFQDGFRMGQSAFQTMLDNKDRETRRKREQETHDLAMQEGGLRMDAARRTASRETNTANAMAELSDFTQGIDRKATNANLDADFEAAYQATGQGLAMPAMRGGSNAANETALTVQQTPDFASPQFQAGLNQRRIKLAAASGNAQDFDRATAAEVTRSGAQADVEFATRIMSNPTGEEATNARSWINKNSSRLTTKVDPKTGLTTFVIPKGDSFDTVDVQPTDLAKIAIGVARLQRNDPSGLEMISAVNKDIAAAAAADWVRQLDAGKANNDAVFKANSMRNDNARTGIAAAAANRDRLGRLQTVIGPDGKPTLAEPALVGGQPTLRPVNMNGMSLGSKQVDPKAYSDTVKNLVDSGVPTPQARMIADDMYGLSQKPSAPGQGGDNKFQQLQAEREAAAKKQGGEPAPATPAQQGGIRLNNREEYTAAQAAMQRGLRLVGRGNSTFGDGELLFEDAQGNRYWQSDINR